MECIGIGVGMLMAIFGVFHCEMGGMEWNGMGVGFCKGGLVLVFAFFSKRFGIFRPQLFCVNWLKVLIKVI